MPSDPHHVQELFLRLVELPVSARAAALDRECGTNTALRQRLEALLQAHDESDSLLDRQSRHFDATVITDSDKAAGNDMPGTTVTSAAKQSGQGFVIADRYTMLEKIGEGGMGEVWVAQQTEPVKRKVALKLIKTGMDSKSVLARFEQERQALALMDHPNIAKVLDGGMTPSGQPFFVMELVNGLPLNKFCDEARLPPKQRLELFVTICQAVQHAHQKGIVHRDLKPANILITIIDGRPVPKVIDFGVAKATSGKITDESMSTQFGAVVGTLEYMSPEQAGFSGEDIDTRADIYSLGVILYEMLTGLRPIDAKRLKKAALTEMIRMIREEEPSKPSTRLSTDDSLPSMAALRQIEPKKLTALLRGELDWVVMKCLEKQRDRRYETANGLARDILRYLADEPVEARPPSAAYRFNKFVSRNRGRVIAAGLVLIALASGVASVVAVQAKANRNLDTKNEELADTNSLLASKNTELAVEQTKVQARFDLAQKAIESFHTGVSEDALLKNVQFKELRTKLLKSAADFYGEMEILLQDENNAKSQKALGAGYFQLAKLMAMIGSPEDALAVQQKSLAVRKRLAVTESGIESQLDVARSLWSVGGLQALNGDIASAMSSWKEQRDLTLHLLKKEPTDTARFILSQSHRSLGVGLSRTGSSSEALEEFQKAFEIQRTLLDENADDRTYLEELAATCVNMGLLLSETGKLEDGIGFIQRTIAIQEKLTKVDPDSPRRPFALADSLHHLANCLRSAGKLQEALMEFRKALEIQQGLVEARPAVNEFHDSLAHSHNAVGGVLFDLGQLEEALAEFQKALVIREKLADNNPIVSSYRESVAVSHGNIGMLQKARGNRVEALAAQNNKRQILEALVATNPAVTNTQSRLADSCNEIGSILFASQELDQSLAAYQESLVLRQTLAKANPSVTQFQNDMAISENNVGNVFMSMGKRELGLESFKRAVAMNQQLVDANPANKRYPASLAVGLCNIAAALTQMGKLDEALAANQRALAVETKVVEENQNLAVAQKMLATIHDNMAHLLTLMERVDSAIDSRNQALAIWLQLVDANSTIPSYQVGLASSQNNLGRLLARKQQFPEAFAALDAAMAIRQELANTDPKSAEYQSYLGYSYAYRGGVRVLAGQPAEAAVDLRRSLELWAIQQPSDSDLQLERCRALALLVGLGTNASSGITAEEATTFSGQAIDALRDAVAAGWKRSEQLKEAEFDSIRDREDFKELVKQLATASPAASEPMP